MKRNILFFAILWICFGSCTWNSAEPDVRLVKSELATVDVFIKGELFTSYQYSVGFVKPIFYPIISVGGNWINRGYPIKMDIPGESRDHWHQKSLWFTYGDVNGVDYWGETPESGKIQHTGFTVKVLKVANSPLYGSRKTCTSIHQAIVRLGFETLKGIVLSVPIFKFFSTSPALNDFSREELWKHSLGAGEAAREIGKSALPFNPDEAYLIGLIHDIGKVILDFYFSQEYVQVGAYIREYNCSIQAAETFIFGFDHSTVGGWLAEQWEFPERIHAGIMYHHSLETVQKQYEKQAIIARLGDYISRSIHFGNGGDNIIPLIEKEYIILQYVSIDDIQRLVDTMQDKKESLEIIYAQF